MKATPKPKTGKCCNCKTITSNRAGLKWSCDIECTIAFTNRALARKKAKEIKVERKEIKAAKERIKPLSKWLIEAQQAFNAWVRLRDDNQPCISCGRHHKGKYNAGHFRSTGAASHLRFNPANVHKQCEPCNSHLSGNIINYRPRLIEKIGLSVVESLENDNAPKKWTVEECKFIKAHYSALTRELAWLDQFPAEIIR